MRRGLEAIWALLKLAMIAGTIALGSCASVRTILQTAPDTLSAAQMLPTTNLLPEDAARSLLQSEIYGPVVTPTRTEVLNRTRDRATIAEADLVQWTIEIDYGGAPRRFDVALLLPDTAGAPVIVAQNFCPIYAVIPDPAMRRPESRSFCEGGGLIGSVFTFFFGRHIVVPPLAEIAERGYGFAAIYPSDVVLDDGEAGQRGLGDLFPDGSDRPGALAVWAGLTDTVAGLVEAEAGERTIIAFGHSRFGKTALLASAFLPSVDAAIAHQSGTLGASSLTDGVGEPLDALINAYPHWGNARLRRYADTPDALPVRPADLLALSSEKPVLLGNAKRDVWSDPTGAFTEAKAAWPDTFAATRPRDFRADDRHAFWLRPGTHGVNKEDWETFLDWLDARDF